MSLETIRQLTILRTQSHRVERANSWSMTLVRVILHEYMNNARHTLSLADPSNITRAQTHAMAAHKLSITLALGPFKFLQKNTVTAMVITVASSEMEQPTVEMISKAFL